MQSSLEEHSDAMAFSEKMLMLSREQTDSLHALRSSLREKEEILMQKVRARRGSTYVLEKHPFSYVYIYIYTYKYISYVCIYIHTSIYVYHHMYMHVYHMHTYTLDDNLIS